MLKAKLADGTPLMHYFRDQNPSFWKGTEFKNFRDFQDIIRNKEEGSEPYYWIQFPKPHNLSTPQLFLDKVKGLERFIWFKNYLFNIEFNPHIHCHLILRRPDSSVRPARIIKNISKYLGMRENHIHIERMNHSILNRISYVKGLKVDADKLMLVQQDKEDRLKYNINTYYSDAESFTKTESIET